MARGKNAPALFDVIHAAKRPPKASPTGGGVPTPKWWSKGKAADADEPSAPTPPAAPTAETSGGTRRSWLAAARESAPPPAESVEHSGVEHLGHDEDVDDRDPAHGGHDRYAPNPAAHYPDAHDEVDPPPAEADEPKVVITRYYPPGSPDRPDAPAAYPDEDAPRSAPPAPAPAADDRPSWTERRAKIVADRAAAAVPPARPAPSDTGYDPTANITAADLRSGRPVQRRIVTPPPPPQPIDEDVPRPPRRSAGPRPSATKPDSAGLGEPTVAVDRDAGEFRFRLSYGGAVAAGVILLVVLAIAYLAGQRAGTVESAADAQPADAQPAAPAQPSVADAAPAVVPGTNPSTPPSAMMAAVSPTGTPTAVARPEAVHTPAAVPPPAVEAPVTRQPGLLYAVVQSYPDRETANAAAAFLNANGCPCTVLGGLNGFALRDWSSVVCLKGFPRTTPEAALKPYLNAITALGPKFSTRKFDQFKPQMYPWRSDSDVPRP